MRFSGLSTTSWVTDTGEIVREESPLGLLTVREPQERGHGARRRTAVQVDMLEAVGGRADDGPRPRIDEPRDVVRLRLRLDGADLSSADLARRRADRSTATIVELVDARTLQAGPADPDLGALPRARTVHRKRRPGDPRRGRAHGRRSLTGARARAERLMREVNGLLDKKPTISLPSAREVLRTKVGDCNEHTALYVALARSVGIPARINVGLVYVLGAFYYHAWPEVYLDEGDGRGLWLPVDPTLQPVPGRRHARAPARGGLDKQAAILPLIGRLKLTVLEVELSAQRTPHAWCGRRPPPTCVPLGDRPAATGSDVRVLGVALRRGADDRRREPASSSTAASPPSTACRSTCSRARSTASSARTAPARPPPSG